MPVKVHQIFETQNWNLLPNLSILYIKGVKKKRDYSVVMSSGESCTAAGGLKIF